MNSAEQLIRHKKIKEKLEKVFPKGKANYTGFTIDVSLGGNEDLDFERIVISYLAGGSINQEFLEVLIKAVDSQIEFWKDAAEKDVEKLKKSLEL